MKLALKLVFAIIVAAGLATGSAIAAGPDGAAYFWKMPPDVEIDVGPTIIHPLPKGYLNATEKYAHR
jgi:hypothetical protein